LQFVHIHAAGLPISLAGDNFLGSPVSHLAFH